MKIKQTNLLWYIACLLLICTWGSGLFIDLTGDAGLYAAIARQMVESGDWLTLRINDIPYDQKPHLLFWIAGAGIKVFGISNFGFKVFLMLSGAAGVYFTWQLGRTISSASAGKLAALFVGTSQICFLYFSDIHTDTVLQTFVTLSLWQFAGYFKYRRTLNFILAFIGTGLAMMTKGPIGAVLQVLFILLYLLVTREYRQFLHPRWLLGILLILLVISPALYHLWKYFGKEGILFYFIHNNTGRVSGKVAGTSTDPFFYLYNLLWAFLPWTVLIFLGVFSEVRTWFRRKNINPFSLSLLGSTLTLFFIYSIARGKAPNYLMILIPPLACVAAWHIIQNGAIHLKNRLLKIQYSVLIILGVFTLLALHVVQYKQLSFLFVLAGAGALLVFFYFRSEHDPVKRVIYSSALMIVLVNLFLNSAVLPDMFRYQGARQALQVFGENRSEKGILKNLQLEEYELFYHADLPVEPFSTWDEFYEFLATDEPWVYTGETGLAVVEEITDDIDTVFTISQRGMNKINLKFLNPATRKESLGKNYLIKVK